MASYSFEDYLKGIRENDPDVVGEIYRSIRPKILASLWKVHKNKELLEDAFQNAMRDVFIQACEERIRIGKARFSTYLHQVVRNQVLKSLRKENKMIPIPEGEVLTDVQVENDLLITQERWEVEKKIWKLILELRPQAGANCEEALKMRFEQGMQMKEIEEALTYRPGAAKQRIRRCLEKLRQLLRAHPLYRQLRDEEPGRFDL